MINVLNTIGTIINNKFFSKTNHSLHYEINYIYIKVTYIYLLTVDMADLFKAERLFCIVETALVALPVIKWRFALKKKYIIIDKYEILLEVIFYTITDIFQSTDYLSG